MDKRVLKLILVFVVLYIVGITGVMHFEGIGFVKANVWTVVIIFSFAFFPMKSLPGEVFQAAYIGAVWIYIAIVLTVLVPIVWDKWTEPVKGTGKIRKGGKIILLVDPVDWEKVLSIRNVLDRQFRLVVVSNLLPDIPSYVMKSGVEFVKGDLRRMDTYLRAGLNWVIGAIICPETYNSPLIADTGTSAYVRLIEGFNPNIITVVEGVSKSNRDLFEAAGTDHICWFDPLTLGAVLQEVQNCISGQDVNIFWEYFDDFQKDEFMDQFNKMSLDVSFLRLSKKGEKVEKRTISPGTKTVEIFTPEDFDNTNVDKLTLAKAIRSTADIAVVLYLSVESDDLFKGLNAICIDKIMASACADKIVAEALVDTMVSSIDQ